MDGGDRGVPIRFIGDEIVPEFMGGEFGRDDYAAAGEERGKESGKKTVDVEEWHDEEGAILGDKIVGLADIFWGIVSSEVPIEAPS